MIYQITISIPISKEALPVVERANPTFHLDLCVKNLLARQLPLKELHLTHSVKVDVK